MQSKYKLSQQMQTELKSQPVQYTDTGPTSPGTDPKTGDTEQGDHKSTNCEVTVLTGPGISRRNLRSFNLWTFHLLAKRQFWSGKQPI